MGTTSDTTQEAKPLHRKLSRELADHLLERKRTIPSLQVLLITDPINDVYGGVPSALLTELRAAGITVVSTDLTALRDSNPGYSALWRGLVQWWGNSAQGGWLPNPFDGGASKVTLRTWLSLLNFKANHRKLLISDRPDGEWQALVASANPHDASSAHSNVAVQVTGELAEVMLQGELNVARVSGWQGDVTLPTRQLAQPSSESIDVEYLSEGAIQGRVLKAINDTGTDDKIYLAMFYLSDREIVDALKQAAGRGVQVKLILDPNKDAFGIHKDGVPNRPVANELMEQGHGRVEVRWYRTYGEQFHTKLLLVQHQGKLFATLGSANFTRRNLDDYNLEANVALSMQIDTSLATALTTYFDRLWSGDAVNAEYTAPFGAYRDDSTARYWRYRVMEATGLSTF
jgi:phosphatidylserine/phosphatidylglycerophosphate/cardiolipin synthase-like enzyme